MEIIQSYHEGLLDIRVLGDLDARSSIELDTVMKTAIDSGHHKIIIDCHGLDFISSAGMGVFISHLEEVKESGGRFVLYNMSPSIYQTFMLLGLHQVLDIVQERKEAKELLNESALNNHLFG